MPKKVAQAPAAAKPAPKTKAIQKQPKNPKARFDIRELKEGHQLSYVTYYRVLSTRGRDVFIADQNGDNKTVSVEILEKWPSADHYAKEVPMTMSSLAELLETFSDTVFSVCFHKLPTVDGAVEKLDAHSLASAKKDAAKLAKEMTEGELCTMVCHLVKVENNLGRSTVIDLKATTPNKFRQVDHRTIEWIVFKNVKYVLKKGAKKAADDHEEEKKKKDEPMWDPKKLAAGNWFSTTMYLDVKSIDGAEVLAESKDQMIAVDTKIVEEEMDCANIYSSEEKLALTKVVKIMKEAHSSAFTVCFNAKVDEKAIQQRLESLKESEFKDKKALAKELLVGAERTVVGRLTKTEAKLGRSLVLGLPNNNFVSVDHRSIHYIILKGVKYIVQ